MYPGMKGDWLGIAFRHGHARRLEDDVIMTTTFGRWVHCEVILGRGEGGNAYGAYQGQGGFLRSLHRHTPDEWEVYAIPLRDPKPLHGHLLYLLSLGIPYNYGDLWQCCVKAMLPFERELDCDRPGQWAAAGGLFCSQAALLVLRHSIRHGLVECPPGLDKLVEATHSRGCSPNTLHGIIARSWARRVV
jgi:hypothetical protein